MPDLNSFAVEMFEEVGQWHIGNLLLCIIFLPERGAALPLLTYVICSIANCTPCLFVLRDLLSTDSFGACLRLCSVFFPRIPLNFIGSPKIFIQCVQVLGICVLSADETRVVVFSCFFSF